MARPIDPECGAAGGGGGRAGIGPEEAGDEDAAETDDLDPGEDVLGFLAEDWRRDVREREQDHGGRTA